MRRLGRRLEVLKAKGFTGAQVVTGGVLDASSVQAATTGAGIVYCLVHSMGSTQSLEGQDRLQPRLPGFWIAFCYATLRNPSRH